MEAEHARLLLRGVGNADIARRLARYAAAVECAAQRLEHEAAEAATGGERPDETRSSEMAQSGGKGAACRS
jgi:hypothetical protein